MDPKSQSLTRQNSLYSLTLDEVQTHLGSSGKSLGSMNLDELLKSVCSVEEAQTQEGLSRNLPKDISKKTVDEVWKDIQQDKESIKLGEMTLEDLLLKAGVVKETVVPWVEYNQPPSSQGFMPYEMGVMVSQTSLMDTQALGRKRVASSGDVVEKTVERRQKRMIKNRESAARSRARKQAYTHELEIKVSRLEEENERLKKQKEIEKILPSAPPPDPKPKLRRTSSSSF